MNINLLYSIDSSTGLMRLNFNKELVKELHYMDKISFEKYILPMLAMNNKLCLTGSFSLKLLGFEPMEKIGDFDLALTESFTEDDYNSIKNFFDLKDIRNGYSWDEEEKIPKFDPNSHLWQFTKEWTEIADGDREELLKVMYFKMDIFNDEIIRKKDIISVFWDDFEVKMVHPSITLSYRMRYALDSRSSTSYKYWKRMDNFMKDAKPYYNLLNLIQKMVMRKYEHNTNVEKDFEKLNFIKQLSKNREENMEKFVRTVFPENEAKIENQIKI
jgi:hypothetical protein